MAEPLKVENLPRIKRVLSKGRYYYYVRTSPTGAGQKSYIRLPEPRDRDFAEVYSALWTASCSGAQNPLQKANGLCVPQLDRGYATYLKILTEVKETGVVTRRAPGQVRANCTPPRFVYFIGGEVGNIKIGLASKPSERLRDLQTGSPIPLRIFATCAGGRSQENRYHKQFKEHRAHGEWFVRHPDILAEIDRLNELEEVA